MTNIAKKVLFFAIVIFNGLLILAIQNKYFYLNYFYKTTAKSYILEAETIVRNNSLSIPHTVSVIADNAMDFSQNIKKQLHNWTCSGNTTSDIHPNPEDLLVCGSIKTKTAQIVLYTTMYYSKDKMFIFKNVVLQWSNIDSTLQPVLFLENDKINSEPGFIELACSRAWIVMRVPLCNKYGFPVLRVLSKTIQESFPHASWMGYANGDMLFSKGLVRTLNYLDEQHIKRFIFAVGQRFDIYIHNNRTIAYDSDFVHLAKPGSIRGHHAIDYFFTKPREFPWHSVPPFVVGRSGFDNWLVDWSRRKVPSVDITESLIAAHQGVAGKSANANSHRSRSLGFHSNDPYMKGANVMMGRTQCLKYKTQDLYNNPFLHWPISARNQVTSTDFNQMYSYTLDSAILLLMLENGYNITTFNSKEIQQIKDKLNLKHVAFDDSILNRLNLSVINTSVTFNKKDEANLPIASKTEDLNEVIKKYPILTSSNLESILHSQFPDLDLDRSHIVLMERTKYPRHCKNLHEPTIIQVKVVHTEDKKISATL